MPNKTVDSEIESKNDIFHQEIIDTFFGKIDREGVKSKYKPKESLAPPKKNKNIMISSIILCISLVFFAAGLLYYLSARGFFIAPVNGESQAGNYTRIFFDGSFNRETIRSFSFDGDAKTKSMMMGDTIKLVNSGSLGWAKAKLEFTENQDFTKLNLLFLMRSQPGPKLVTLILTDTLGNTRRAAIKISPSWDIKNITFRDKNYFDLRKVCAISVEFGTSTTGNSEGSEIYIKEIGARRAND